MNQPQTADQINLSQTGQIIVEKKPFPATSRVNSQKLSLPVTEPHPLRFGILGITDKVADLKAYVQSPECNKDGKFDPALRAFICTELDKIETNAACIHLHDVARRDGGFDLHLSIVAVHLGPREGSSTTGLELTALHI